MTGVPVLRLGDRAVELSTGRAGTVTATIAAGFGGRPLIYAILFDDSPAAGKRLAGEVVRADCARLGGPFDRAVVVHPPCERRSQSGRIDA